MNMYVRRALSIKCKINFELQKKMAKLNSTQITNWDGHVPFIASRWIENVNKLKLR